MNLEKKIRKNIKSSKEDAKRNEKREELKVEKNHLTNIFELKTLLLLKISDQSCGLRKLKQFINCIKRR